MKLKRIVSIYIIFIIIFSIGIITQASAQTKSIDFADLLGKRANWVKDDAVKLEKDSLIFDKGENLVAGNKEKAADMELTVKVKANIDNPDGYLAIIFRADKSKGSPWEFDKAYYMTLRRDYIAVSKVANKKMSAMAKNESLRICNDGKEHIIKLLCVNNSDGSVGITVTVDGKEILKTTDKDNAHKDEGFLGFLAYGNTKIVLTGTKEVVVSNEKALDPKAAAPSNVFTARAEPKDKAVRLIWRYNPKDKFSEGAKIYSQGKVVGQVKAPIKEWTATNLENGKEYSYEIKAVNENGVESAKAVKLTCVAGAAPNPEKPYSPLPRISTVSGDPAGFVIKSTGTEFIANGTNYVRLANDHSVFYKETYDHEETVYSMKQMKKYGYKVVRVFVSGRNPVAPGISGNLRTTQGLEKEYMDNIIDFVKCAAAEGLYVQLCFNELPINDYFRRIRGEAVVENGKTLISTGNVVYYTKGGLEAKKEFIRIVMNHIKAKDPTLFSSIFSIEIENEQMAWENEPFNLKSGKVTVVDGKTYDMSSEEEKDRLKENCYIYYANELVKLIKSIDPEMMASGTAILHDPNDARIGITKKGIATQAKTNFDYLDIHYYPGVQSYESMKYDFFEDINHLGYNEIKETLKTKPFIIGEYGILGNSKDYEGCAVALKSFVDIIYRSGMRGWYTWTFDTEEQTDIVHGTYGDNAINKAVGNFKGTDDSLVNSSVREDSLTYTTVYKDTFSNANEGTVLDGRTPEISTTAQKWQGKNLAIKNNMLARNDNKLESSDVSLATLPLPEINQNSVLRIKADIRPHGEVDNWIGLGFTTANIALWDDKTGGTVWAYLRGPLRTSSFFRVVGGRGTNNTVCAIEKPGIYKPGEQTTIEVIYNLATDNIICKLGGITYYTGPSGNKYTPNDLKYLVIQYHRQNNYKNEKIGYISNLELQIATDSGALEVKDEISVSLNGNELKFDQAPIIQNGRTLVPLRAIFEALGANVQWQSDTQTATATLDGITVSMVIDSMEAQLNGKNVPLDQAAMLVNGRTLVPIRFVSESLGASVVWNQDTKKVIINTK